MGFYGNITNVSGSTVFTFDKVYSNRATMESEDTNDHVYVGRYVLIDYDDSSTLSSYAQVYRSTRSSDTTSVTVNGTSQTGIYLYDDRTLNEKHQYTESSSGINAYEIVYVDEATTTGGGPYSFYMCIGKDSNNKAIFQYVTEEKSSSYNSYAINYQKDSIWATTIKGVSMGRGWDSTVWQKVYEDGEEKYVMVAELNSVVPTFDVSAEAPTSVPIAPHFDAASNNVYYKLHWQPSWGVRIKTLSNDWTGPEINENGQAISGTSVKLSSDTTNYLDSDVDIIWTRYDYDSATNKEVEYYYNHTTGTWDTAMGTASDYSMPAAIYWNRKGFDKTARSNVGGTDAINLAATGLSGHLYETHEGVNKVGEKTAQVDTQEFSVMLPSLGNAVSDMWDLVYGTNRNLDVNWDSKNGIRLVTSTGNGYMYNTNDVTTLAGCINSVHDLMGMIIINQDPDNAIYNGTADINKIYYSSGDKKFYRIKTEYTFTEISTLTSGTDYYIIDGNGIYNNGMPWTDNYIPDGMKIGTRSSKLVKQELIDFADKLNTIHGLILKINAMLESGDEATRDTATVQGSINTLNDIINRFGEFTEGEIVIIDNYGRIVSSPYTTAQTFTAYNEGTKENINKTETEDQWVKLDIDTTVNSPKITIEHNFTSVDDTKTASNKNKALTDVPTGYNKLGINNNDSDNVISLYTPIVDSTGHVVGKNIEDVTLPNAIRQIKINEQSTDVTDMTANTNTVIADNSHDEFNFSSGNKWIKLAGNDDADTITIAHEVHDMSSGTANTQYGLTANKSVAEVDNNNNQFTVPTFKFDEAGHMTMAEDHTVTLPDNFDKVTITTDTADNVDSLAGAAGTVAADNMTDTMTLAEGNKWINIEADADNDKVTFKHYIKQFTETTDKVDQNTSTNNQFTVQDIQWDNAGHLTASKKTTYTIPNDYKTIVVKNDGNALTSTSSTAADATLTAANSVDQITFNTGNRWINLKADSTETNKSITLYHAPAGTTSSSVGDTSNQTPAFGSTFKALSVGIDQTGHVKDLAEHTVQIPKGSYTNTPAAEGATGVITGLGFTDTTGAITSTSNYLGNIVLGSYTVATAIKTNAGTSINASSIVNSNTLANAINVLDTRIMAEEKSRADAIDAEKEARKKAINDLDVTDTADTTQIISTISQTDGKISFSRAAAGTLLVAGTKNAGNETLNSIKDRVDILTSGSTVEGSVAYQIATIVNDNNNGNIDTLNEIASWIINDTTGAAKISSNIDTLQEEVETAKTGLLDRTTALETLVGTTSVSSQISTITGTPDKDNTLQGEIDTLEELVGTTAVSSQISTITGTPDSGETLQSEIDDLEAKDCMSISAEDITNWGTAYTNTHTHTNKDILDDITQDDIDTWNAAEANDENTVLTTTEFTYTYNGADTNMTIQALLNKVAELEGRIKVLEPTSTPEEESPSEEESPETV